MNTCSCVFKLISHLKYIEIERRYLFGMFRFQILDSSFVSPLLKL